MNSTDTNQRGRRFITVLLFFCMLLWAVPAFAGESGGDAPLLPKADPLYPPENAQSIEYRSPATDRLSSDSHEKWYKVTFSDAGNAYIQFNYINDNHMNAVGLGSGYNVEIYELSQAGTMRLYSAESVSFLPYRPTGEPRTDRLTSMRLRSGTYYIRVQELDPSYIPATEYTLTIKPWNEEEIFTGWRHIDGKAYFYVDGALQTGWVPYGRFDWYFADENGCMQTGWVHVPDRTMESDNRYWYYLDSSAGGVMRRGSWLQWNGNWYYFHWDGYMVTGWAYDDRNGANKWYFMDDSGAMRTGWLPWNDGWYYLNRNGDMATGWIEWNNDWYYLKNSGAMAAEEWVPYGSRWYWLKSSGKMAENEWIQWNGGWYWIKPSGVMAAGETLRIGGQSYTFSASGKWIG